MLMVGGSEGEFCVQYDWTHVREDMKQREI